MESLRRLGVPPSMIDEVEQAGRNSDIKLFKSEAGSFRIVFKLQEGTVPGIAREHLALVLSSIGHKCHHLDVVKHNDGVAIDSQLCGIIQSELKDIKELEISFLKRWDASEVDNLLKHMPSGLSKLTIYEPGEPSSSSFRLIPLLLPNLRALEFHDCCLQEEWVDLIGRLPSLETLTFLGVLNKKEDWTPVLLAIQAHTNLKAVRFENIHDFGDQAIKFDKETEDAILCRLAINKANAQLKLGCTANGGPTLKNWVNTVIASRHQIGCLDYLLSSVDPTIFAPAAIKGLQGPDYKRKREQAFGSENGADERHQELKRQRELGEEELEEERARVFVPVADDEDEGSDSDDGN